MTTEIRQQHSEAELLEIAQEIANRPRAQTEIFLAFLKLSARVDAPETPEQAKALFSTLCAEVQDKTVKTYPELQQRMDAIAAILPSERAQK